jgi:alpha-glucosidase (family GH31 glycosyl hydrolase)
MLATGGAICTAFTWITVVAGIWNDMNEPSDFVDQTGGNQRDVVSYDEGQKTTHAKNRNVVCSLDGPIGLTKDSNDSSPINDRTSSRAQDMRAFNATRQCGSVTLTVPGTLWR